MAIKRINTYNNNEENNDVFGVVTVHQNQYSELLNRKIYDVT